MQVLVYVVNESYVVEYLWPKYIFHCEILGYHSGDFEG